MTLDTKGTTMRKRMAVILLVGLGLLTGGSAGAQTTTSTSSTSSTSTSTSSTTSTLASTSTTSTTVGNPCAGKPCTADPPAAFLSAGGTEVRLNEGGYCWQAPEGGSARCVTIVPTDPSAQLSVRAGDTLTLRFGIGMAPTSVAYAVGDRGATTPVAATNPTSFRADFPVGSHVLTFTTRWLQGDASYRVRLDVRAANNPPPATPKRDPIALTG